MKHHFTKTVFVFLFLVAAIFASFTVRAADGRLTVHSNLSGRLTHLNYNELALTFSHDMLALGGTRDGASLVSITPHIDGDFSWRGTKKLVFTPKKGFKYSTKYTVTVKKGARSPDGKTLKKKKRWYIVTPPAVPRNARFSSDRYNRSLRSGDSLKDVYPGDNLVIGFLGPVDIEQFRKKCKISEPRSKKKISFTYHMSGNNGIEIRFTKPLKRGTTYRLLLAKGLKGTGGNYRTSKPFHFTFSTYPPPSFTGPETFTLRPYESGTLKLDFSTPMAESAAKDITIIKTSAAGAKTQLPQNSYQTYVPYYSRGLLLEIDGPFATGDRFDIVLEKSIKDKFGVSLGKDIHITARVCSPMPSVRPGFGRDWVDLHLTGVKRLNLTLFKFEDILPGLLRKPPKSTTGDSTGHSGTQAPVVRILETRQLEPETKETKTVSLDFPNEVGSPYGFFGVMVNSIEPYNYCGEKRIDELSRAYPSTVTIFHNRSIDFIMRTGGKNEFFRFYNAKTGSAISGAQVRVLREGKELETGKADDNGIWQSPLKFKKEDVIVATDPQTDSKVYHRLDSSSLHRYGYEEDEDEETQTAILVFTDRYFYRPGSAVHIGGVVREFKNGKPILPELKEAKLIIESPEMDDEHEAKITLDHLGGFSYTFQTTKGSEKGNYWVHLEYKDKSEDTVFTVEYFQTDTFTVDISGLKKVYTKNGVLAPGFSANYLSGTPMGGSELELHLVLQGIDGYSDSFSGGPLGQYNFGLAPLFRTEAKEPELDDEIVLDKNGTARIQLPLSKLSALNCLTRLIVGAHVESEEGKDVWTDKKAEFFPGNRIVGIKVPYFTRANQPIEAKLAVVDPEGRPAGTKAVITIYKNAYDLEGDPDEIPVAQVYKNLTFTGKDSFRFQVEEADVYFIKCDAIDDDGAVVSTSARFYAGGWSDSQEGKLEISSAQDKDAYKLGETIPFIIRSPNKGHALITIEQDRVVDHFTIDLENVIAFNLPIKKEYFPFIRVIVSAVYDDGGSDDAEMEFTILNDEKRLKVAVTPRANPLEPGTESVIDVGVTDQKGNGQKARVFLYAVNEGTLRVKYNYMVPNIFARMYHWAPWDRFPELFSVFSRSGENTLFYRELLINNMGRMVTGRVTDEENRPLEGVTVKIYYGAYNAAEPGRPHRTARTSADGFYLFTGLHRGLDSYSVVFEKKGFRTAMAQPQAIPVIYRLSPRLSPITADGKIKEISVRTVASALLKLGGTVTLEDLSHIPGVMITLNPLTGKNTQKKTTISNEKGQYYFTGVAPGEYELRFELEGFKTVIKTVSLAFSDTIVDVIMKTGELREEVTVTGKVAVSPSLDYGNPPPPLDKKELQSLLRKDFKELLFFKVIETDANGHAQLDFKSSHMLTTYRVMAVAYAEEKFGSGQASLLVTKDMFMEEAMPEFARKNDRFNAGVQVSNRTANPLKTDVYASSQTVTVTGGTKKQLTLDPRSNKLVYFDFSTSKAGENQVKFYALSKALKDGLLKTLPVHGTMITETLLDFDIGKNLRKQVQPQSGATKETLTLQAAPSILKPAGKIAKKLIFYPYECLEQRTSKMLPYLILADTAAAQMGIAIDKQKFLESFKGYVEILPEFMDEDDGLCYYRGSDRASGYLTAYVYWALKLAQKRGLPVDPAILERIDDYLSYDLKSTYQAVYQFARSMDGSADAKTLLRLYKKRQELPLTSRVFLYRAIDNQLRDRKKLEQMLTEFNDLIRVEGDIAYFTVGDYRYDREFPFYGSRFASALILQAVLEVEGRHEHAMRIINGLLQAPPYMWETTQTNFWVLYAMDQYARQVEKGGPFDATVDIRGQRWHKTFTDSRDVFTVKKTLGKSKTPVNIALTSQQDLFLTTTLESTFDKAGPKSRGITVQRKVYDKTGKIAQRFVKGDIYMVELLVDVEEELPYGVVDEPLAAGFEVIRQDLGANPGLKEFNKDNAETYRSPYAYPEHWADRIVIYSYSYRDKIRFVYFVKAMYTGTFTWMPTVVQGMYHPQYYGRGATQTINIKLPPTALTSAYVGKLYRGKI